VPRFERCHVLKLVFLVFVLSLQCFACFWSYERNLHGQEVVLNEHAPEQYVADLRRQYDADYWNDELKDLESKPVSVESQNDMAVALAHLGRYREALTYLEKIEQTSPSRYETAANLGTTYELLGQDQVALKWIREALHRNPSSHHGTEWLHVRILEAKLALRKDPNWLRSHIVLGYNFGDGPEPKLPAALSSVEEQNKVQRAIEYQLGERLMFVKPPDPMVADLLYSLASLRSLTTSVERGIVLLRYGLSFGPANRQRFKARLDYLDGIPKPIDYNAWFAAAGVILLGAGILLLLRYKR
jgi:tetratricopeptide (TPR) repeat protein